MLLGFRNRLDLRPRKAILQLGLTKSKVNSVLIKGNRKQDLALLQTDLGTSEWAKTTSETMPRMVDHITRQIFREVWEKPFRMTKRITRIELNHIHLGWGEMI